MFQTCGHHKNALTQIARRLMPGICIVLLGLIGWIEPAFAESKDPDPRAPSLYQPNPDRRSGLETWGPGGGPIRKDSTAADIHETVEGFTPSRRCLSCHVGQDENLHYARTTLRCRTCHGESPYAGIRNPASPLFRDHRHKVCAECHEGAQRAMASYVIHEPFPLAGATRVEFPALFWASAFMVTLAGAVFVVFLPYVSAWALREVILRFQGGRGHANPEPEKFLRRFTRTQATFHTVLAICFMALSVTGIAWMYIETDFGAFIAEQFGGYKNVIAAHRWIGLILMGVFAAHVIYLIRQVNWDDPKASLYSPDSIAWKIGDFHAFQAHLKWVFGLGEAPAFDRWTWWQKFDYWAVWWGLVIVGTTGLILYDPVWTSAAMPGWVLNVARWVHKIEAILAMAHIFVVHFFIESYRPRAFPLNTQVFHGAQRLEEARHEHPEWVARLERDGRVEAFLVPEPPVPVRIAWFGLGYALVLMGVALLVFAAINIGSISL